MHETKLTHIFVCEYANDKEEILKISKIIRELQIGTQKQINWL